MSIKMIRVAHYLPNDSYPFDIEVNSIVEEVTVDTSGNNWWFVGGGLSNDILPQVEAAVESHSETPPATVSINSDFRVRIDTPGNGIAVRTVDVDTVEEILGFFANQPEASGGITADTQFHGLWRPGRPGSRDTRDQVKAVGGTRSSVTGLTRSTNFGNMKAHRDLRWQFCTREVTMAEFAADDALTIERIWLDQIARGAPIMLYEDDAFDAIPVPGTYVCRDIGKHPYKRNSRWGFRWDVELDLIKE